MKRILIDINQLATRLCIGKNTLYQWVYQRRIPFIKVGGRCLRFDPEEIERWLHRHDTMVEAGKR